MGTMAEGTCSNRAEEEREREEVRTYNNMEEETEMVVEGTCSNRAEEEKERVAAVTCSNKVGEEMERGEAGSCSNRAEEEMGKVVAEICRSIWEMICICSSRLPCICSRS